MKKHYKHLAVLGTLCTFAALGVLWCSVLTTEWLSLEEPQVDQLELDKLGPNEEATPHIIQARFGLFKMCVNNTKQNSVKCQELDWYNWGFINLNIHFNPKRPPLEMPTELIANCVEKLRLTLPFIGLSVMFTSASFFCLTFGHFCQKNKKIIEASMLILGGLCQATALLTFVSQVGSEFEANMPYSYHQRRLTTFYKYKYGYSFYLFLLSFSLSELAALFDMAAYFRKFPPSHYVITFHRQAEPSPFMGTATNVVPNHIGNYQNTLSKHPDICNDFSSEHIDLSVTRLEDHQGMPLPPQSYISPEVTITTIERNSCYGTLRNPKTPATATMESFGTMKKENNL